MKAVNESTWTMQIMIFFILIFATFLVLVLSYNKAYQIKNRMLSIIEKYEGVTLKSAEFINDYAYNKSYTNTGKCPSGWIGVTNISEDVSSQDFEVADGKKKYYYCFRENVSDDTYLLNNNVYYKVCYDVMVFYRFNLPVIGSIANYKIEGTTKSFVGSNDRIRS